MVAELLPLNNSLSLSRSLRHKFYVIFSYFFRPIRFQCKTMSLRNARTARRIVVVSDMVKNNLFFSFPFFLPFSFFSQFLSPLIFEMRYWIRISECSETRWRRESERFKFYRYAKRKRQSHGEKTYTHSKKHVWKKGFVSLAVQEQYNCKYKVKVKTVIKETCLANFKKIMA